MIAIPPIDCTAPGVLVSTNAVDASAWVVGTTYAADVVISHTKRNWTSVQAGNVGKTPGSEPLWWVDADPINSLALFDSSVQTATTRTGGLTFTLAVGRATAVGFMGLVGQAVTLTVRDGLGGEVIDTRTQTLRVSDGTYYGFAFEGFQQQTEVTFSGLKGSVNGHITIEITGAGTTACGLCVVGKQFDCGKADYGFSVSLEDRGRQYLDALSNPVSVERGYSRGCSGSLINDIANYNRLIAFYSANINNPCLWVAAPGIADLVSATVFGKLARVVPVISNAVQITTAIDISGYR